MKSECKTKISLANLPHFYSLVRQPVLFLEQLLARQTIGHVLDHICVHNTHSKSQNLAMSMLSPGAKKSL